MFDSFRSAVLVGQSLGLPGISHIQPEMDQLSPLGRMLALQVLAYKKSTLGRLGSAETSAYEGLRAGMSELGLAWLGRFQDQVSREDVPTDLPHAFFASNVDLFDQPGQLPALERDAQAVAAEQSIPQHHIREMWRPAELVTTNVGTSEIARPDLPFDPAFATFWARFHWTTEASPVFLTEGGRPETNHRGTPRDERLGNSIQISDGKDGFTVRIERLDWRQIQSIQSLVGEGREAGMDVPSFHYGNPGTPYGELAFKEINASVVRFVELVMAWRAGGSKGPLQLTEGPAQLT